MPIYEQAPIRLQLSLASNPPVDPVDANTGLVPRCWRGETVSLQLGIFDALGNPVDLSNLTFLQIVLQNASNSLAPLVVKTIAAVDIKGLTNADWIAGLGEQATCILAAADTDQGLNAEDHASFWLVIQGKTNAGSILTYGAGEFQIWDAGVLIPSPLAGYVSRNEQPLVSGNIVAQPTSNNHTEVVDLDVTTGSHNIILPIAGIADGALMRVLLNLNNTPGIVLTMCSGDLTHPINSVTTVVGVLTALLEYYFDYPAQTWKALPSISSSSATGLPVTDSTGMEITDSSGNPITTT